MSRQLRATQRKGSALAMTDKRIQRSERALDGACACCGRRHIHRDDCETLKRRERSDRATDEVRTPRGEP